MNPDRDRGDPSTDPDRNDAGGRHRSPGPATAPVPAQAHPSPASPPPDGEQRGSTHVADRVVERIAGQAVAEVDRAGGLSRRVLGVQLGADSPERAARTTARVDGGIVTVAVQMSVLYPSSVRQTAARVRDHVTDRVGALAGLEVKYVDVEVARLLPPAHTGRGVR